MKKKAIIFDFDGTIVNSLHYLVSLYNLHAKKENYQEVNEELLQKLRGMNYLDIIYELKIPLLKIPFLIHTIRNELHKNMNKMPLFPGIKEVIIKLKESKYILGILTSNSQENVNEFLKLNKINVFDFVHSESDLFGKDHALKELLKEYKLNHDEVIYIGDEVRDINACKKNSIDIISVTYGFSKKEILEKHYPNYIVEKPKDIIEIIYTPPGSETLS